MGISFIHLSDIHFSKLSGTSIDIDADLRNAVLTDIKYNLRENLQDVVGILVGGDVAFSAQKNQYKQAKEFLKGLTDGVGINEKSILDFSLYILEIIILFFDIMLNLI